MEKITLTNIFLLNWYGFVKTLIPVDEDLTFITGENESGKSTILDAFKYAFLSDIEFNKSSGTAKRDLKSYTRCLIDPSIGRYARSADVMHTVYSHIALEFHNNLDNNYFVLGTIIETTSSDDTTTYRYVLEKKQLKDINFTYRQNEKEIPYSAKKFSDAYSTALLQVREGTVKFMNMVGLRLDEFALKNYRNKLRNMMSYDAKSVSKIPEFIKKYVLEANDIDFEKLKKSKENINKLNDALKVINDELKDLEEINDNFEELEKIKYRLKADEVKDIYEKKLELAKKIADNKQEIKRNEIEIKELEVLIPELEIKQNEISNELISAKTDLKQLDCSKAIEDEKLLKGKKESELPIIENKKNELNHFQKIIKEIVDNHLVDGNDVLLNLKVRNIEVADKKYEVEKIKGQLNEKKDAFTLENGELGLQLKQVETQIKDNQAVLNELSKNRQDYSHVANQVNLINEIKREFERRKINSEVKFVSEYVVSVQSEWQEAIETFLGNHRYAILVEPQYFDIANEVFDNSNHRFVELVNTYRLMKYNVEVEEDAVVKKLEIRNVLASKYFAFWLGRIHAVDLKEVHKYDNALSKEGKMSRNMAVTYLNLGKTKNYCLGLEAIELTRKKFEKELNNLIKQQEGFNTQIRNNKNSINYLTNILENFKEYDFDADWKFEVLKKEIQELNIKIKELELALKNNSEYLALASRVSNLEKEYNQILGSIGNKKSRIGNLNHSQKLLKEDSEIKKKEIVVEEENLKQLEIESSKYVSLALQECSKYNLETISKSKRQLTTRRSDESRKNSLEATISVQQREYNSKQSPENQLSIGLDKANEYQKRYQKIKIDNLEELMTKMKEQTNRYELIFKNEFVLHVYDVASEALKDVANINRELRNLKFSTKYQFDVGLMNDNSDFATIIKYAKYLSENDNKYSNQIDIFTVNNNDINELEKDIQEIINRITQDGHSDEMAKFADYRNYMHYEITIENEDIHNGKLSKQIGYNSGAGTQIPYLLILSASLSMLYNARVNSARLIFIDEPFEKMADSNIKEMLGFFKQQNFQVILCAPNNKMDSIGYECNTVVPVLKLSNANMQIGSVKFNDNKGL